jgi:hypothetical protein
VEITNHSTLPVTKIEIENVVHIERPDYPWRVNRRVIGAQASRENLAAKTSMTVPVEFTNAAGELMRVGVGSYEITISFTDAAGRRWRRAGSDNPQPLPDESGNA